MAEIILPPEEEQGETPQVPELNIDKPSRNSKVITIEFEAKKTNKVSTKDTNQQLYTTDTDAWFEFKETSLEGANGTYSVVFRNSDDGSIFQRTGDVLSGVAYYKIPHQEIRHAGAWRGQIVYTLSNGDTTSREFGYDVKGHILDGKDVQEIVVEDFETLIAQLRSMKDNVKDFIEEIEVYRPEFEGYEREENKRVENEIEREVAESARVQNETSRAEAEDLRGSAESTRESNEDERIESEDERADAEITREENEISRQSAEAYRQSTFDDNETNRNQTFTQNESSRQTTFEENERERQTVVKLTVEQYNALEDKSERSLYVIVSDEDE